MKNQNRFRILGGFCSALFILGPAAFLACGQTSSQDSTSALSSSNPVISPSASNVFSIENAPATCPASFVVEQTEGPYYKSGSPERTNLMENGVIGRPLTLTGYVFDKNCNPISGAWIDFWQADGNGNYDNTGYKLRGHQFTDAQGKYVLQTVMPGEYPGRTNHIHVKLSKSEASGKTEGAGNVITTQLYFPGSPQNSSDGIFNESMLVTLGDDRTGQKMAFFNFKLNQ